ncbi:MAG: ABC transporter permease [Acidobacteria bacterium]|nr:ABC transporter permease [Acidobacteriota bacterium]
MLWKDAAILAGANLRQTPIRAVLTTLGVVIGIGMLVCMVAFGLGVRKLATDQVERYAFMNTITVFPKAPNRRARALSEKPDTRAPLDDAMLRTIAGLAGVKSVTPLVTFPLEIIAPDQSLTVLGQTMTADESANQSMFELSAGQFFTGPHAGETIIHEELLSSLGFEDAAAALGRTVDVSFLSPKLGGDGQGIVPGLPSFAVERRQASFRVVGVLHKSEGIFGNPLLRADLLLPLGTAMDLGLHQLLALQGMIRDPQNHSTYASVEVRLEPGTPVADMERQIRDLGLRTMSFQTILEQMNQFFLIMNSVLGVTGSVALLVAALGIANTMIITILERRREIGVMKAVGSTRGAVRQLFFVESAIIGVIGGILGYGLGWLTSLLINWLINIYLRSQGGRPEVLFHFPVWLFVGAVVFAVAVALAAALYPASRAARLDPVDSLRYE